MATPDDLEEFRACQEGFKAGGLPWNDMCRGATHWINGPDDAAKALDLKPVMSGAKSEDEGLYTIQHRYWVDYLSACVDKTGSDKVKG